MECEAAMRTGEQMAMTFPTQTTAGAVLARIARVYPCYEHPMNLCLARDCLTDSTMLPEREPTAQGSSSDLALSRLGQMQVLKDQHSVLRSPLDKLFSGLLGKGA